MLEDAPARDPALRRLSRTAWRRSVEDALGVVLDDDAVPDLDVETRHYHDQADGLPVSPLWFELHDRATADAVTRALAPPPEVMAGVALPSNLQEPWSPPPAAETFELQLTSPEPGEYDVRLTFEIDAGRAPPYQADLQVTLDGGAPTPYVLPTFPTSVFTWQLPTLTLAEGRHTLAVKVPRVRSGGVLLATAEVVVRVEADISGPAVVPEVPRTDLVTCEVADEACRLSVVLAVAGRAWRRPVTAEEVQPLLSAAEMALDDGGTPDDALALALRGVLMHSRFLFRVEPDAAEGRSRPLAGHELATRLSYLLWDRPPDEGLKAAAADGSLLTDEGLRAATRRMLADPKASALADGFFDELLRIDEIDHVWPSSNAFPDFDHLVRDEQAAEARAFVRSFVGTGRDVRELLTGADKLVGPRLAAHYGVAAGEGAVTMRLSERPGLLGLGGLLAVLSHPDRTSPTVRGKYVLDRLLCDPPGAPPPFVPNLRDDTGTVADAVSRHASDPACAGCHTSIDPLGMALEHFDATGAWRDADRGEGIDARGELVDGTVLYGLSDLAAWVAADPRFTRCLVRELAVHALGRDVGASDAASLDAAHAAMLAAGGSFDAALEAWVLSEAFRTHRGSQ